MHFKKLPKLEPGDKVAILSPSFAAPAIFPKVFELGLDRLRSEFGLEPIEFPTTRTLNAPAEDRARDLVAAFEDPKIKAVIASIGGDDQVTYIKKLPNEPFVQNPKPFFGYSDNTHFMNFLWLNGIPSYYGGSIMTQFAMQGQMDEYTVKFLRKAFFENVDCLMSASESFNEIGLDWSNDENIGKRRIYEDNNGWNWNVGKNGQGIIWGGCLESIDEMMRHGIELPSLTDFESIILMTETSEEMPKASDVGRIYRAFGERGILERAQGILVGRPKAWEFDNPREKAERERYRNEQMEAIQGVVRKYNQDITVVQNLDFGHTDPQIPMPLGQTCKVDAKNKTIDVRF